MSKRVVIAIDGPAAAGKSTVARELADKLGFIYIDSGAMYRAVALWALRIDVSLSDMHRLEQLARAAEIAFEPRSQRVLLNGEDVTVEIRAPDVSSAASKVAAIPGVRRALVEKQRHIAASASVVMEGRDIGSVVFPDAQVKVFLDADAGVRSQRRALEMRTAGMAASASGAAARDLAERDERDRTRQESPLIQAPDAVYIDSSSLDAVEVRDILLRIVRERVSNGEDYRG